MKDLDVKENALVKLGLWIVFIVIIIMVSYFNRGNNEVNKETKKEVNNSTIKEDTSYENMQKQLLNSSYYYTYEITKNDKVYKYTGSKCKDINEGYKETSDGIIKYYIDKDVTYKINMDEKVEYNDLYAEFDGNYLDINNLFNNLKDYLYKIDEEDNLRKINYTKEGYQVSVIVDKTNINTINIKTDDTTYYLRFINIGYCNNIKGDNNEV